MEIQNLMVKLSDNLYRLFEYLNKLDREELEKTKKLLVEVNTAIEKIIRRSKN